MDDQRFDNLTRRLATSRRGLFKFLAVGVAAGITRPLQGGFTAAQSCRTHGRKCADHAECCSGTCDPATGRCVCPAGTEDCRGDCIPLAQYSGDIDNCGSCRNRCRQADDCKAPACLDGVCGTVPDPAQIEQPCGPIRGIYGVCLADGTCACPSHLPTECSRGCVDLTSDPRNCGACDTRCPGVPHGSGICDGGACGFTCDAGYNVCGGGCCLDGRNCCDGVCCPSGQCCANGTCSTDACAPHCEIDGIWTADGTINPENECEICDRDRNETGWSTAVSGTPCGEPGQCCNLGVCQACGCRIGEVDFETGARNPNNPCEACDPVRDPLDWSPLSSTEACGDFQSCCEGTCCGPGECCNLDGDCEPCRCVIDRLDYDPGDIDVTNYCQYCDPGRSTTEWSPVADYTECDSPAGRVCCKGNCCSPTECCTPNGCEECGEICRIDERDVPAGEVSPDDPCLLCDPETHAEDWSEAPDGFVCGGVLEDEQVCCRGRCCEPGECCDDGCKPCRCHIGGFPWDAGARNPFNHCEICDPARSQEAWSPAQNGASCGDGDDQTCCAGQCCPEGQCCNEIGECAPCPCRINGQDVVDGGVNPANTCQVCDVDRDRDGWSTLDDGESCGSGLDDRVCCNGTCCPQGQCCENGSCQECGCEIDGQTIDPGTPNPENPCQFCDPLNARLAWSPVASGTSCGADGEQQCCGGECCASDECCILDTCGTCLCQIDGEIYPGDTPNPANACEVCEPDEEPFAWSAAADGSSCGEDQVCCSGDCCEPGLCCVLGLCQVCGCLIGEEQFAELAVNPDNECEWCDPTLDPLAWSHRSDEPCGENGDQVCCSGACCAAGYCCGLDGACEPCPCEIEGVVYPAGTPNPINPCETCDSHQDPAGWSHAAPNTPCGSGGEESCCNGVCCGEEQCCHVLDNACGPEPCHCTIDEIEVAEGEHNPFNECEHCDPTEDSLDWTPVGENAPCGENGDQVCCLGTCCASGDCCTLDICGPCGCEIDGASYGTGTVDPANPCQICDPTQSPVAWSPVADDTACGLVQVCCDGVCCGPNECCGVGGACEQCAAACTIGGVGYGVGASNPVNACEVCDPAESTFEWSPAPDNSVCGEFEDQVCCDGVCCNRGWCCLEGRCEAEMCNDPCIESPELCVCVIDGATYQNGELNPNNPCQQCAWHVSPVFWTEVADDEPCGPNGEQYCCMGTCCAEGQCCTNDRICMTGGSTVCNGCDIDGRFYPITTVNPENACEWCAPFYSTTEWTIRDNHATCGASGERNCCNGICCAAGLCCTGTSVGGTCEPCGCEINGGSYVAGQINPANWCQHCDPEISTTSWSVSEVSFCSFDYSRDCCEGVCCLPGTCCGFSGVCEPMLPDVSNCVNWQFP